MKKPVKFTKEEIMKASLAFAALVLLVVSCSYVNKWIGLEDDNMAEEILEDVIEGRTGIDIDLTPDSEEYL